MLVWMKLNTAGRRCLHVGLWRRWCAKCYSRTVHTYTHTHTHTHTDTHTHRHTHNFLFFFTRLGSFKNKTPELVAMNVGSIGARISSSIGVTQYDISPYGSSFRYCIHTPEAATTHTPETTTKNYEVYGHGLTRYKVWLLALRHALRDLRARQELRGPLTCKAIIGIKKFEWLATAFNRWLEVWEETNFCKTVDGLPLQHEVKLRWFVFCYLCCDSFVLTSVFLFFFCRICGVIFPRKGNCLPDSVW